MQHRMQPGVWHRDGRPLHNFLLPCRSSGRRSVWPPGRRRPSRQPRQRLLLIGQLRLPMLAAPTRTTGLCPHAHETQCTTCS